MGGVSKPKPVVLYIANDAISLVVVGGLLFWCAGRVDWWAAWALIGVWVIWFALVDLILFRSQPELVAERMSPPKGAFVWDRVILSVLRLVQLGRYIIAGLDQRYGWTGSFAVGVQVVSIVVCLFSTGLFGWAPASNSFFSQVVRIQTERGHTVAMGGPYRIVRHPGYLGMILFEFGISALLGSVWGVLAGVVCALLFILRMALEDRTLLAELPGYAEYARRVRYRLLPGVW